MAKRKFFSMNDALETIKKLEASEVEWYSVQEVAEIINRSYGWLWGRINRGEIESKKDITKGVKNTYRIVNKDSVKKFLNDYISSFQ
jgi:Holliday junction resolvasome RuvABC ATP-dependent DNA helicase subunit